MKKLTKHQELDLVFFENNLDKWLQDVAYKDKFVIISNQVLQAVFDEGATAYRYAIENLTLDEFIIKKVVSREDAVIYLPTTF